MSAQPAKDKPRVLVYERMDPSDASLKWLEQNGILLTIGSPMWQAPYMRYSEDEISAAAADHVAVMGASGARFTAEVIRRLPHLRFISKFGVGVDNIDIEAANARGILIANTPAESEVSDVAEHTLAMILALRKQLLRWTPEYMRAGGWRPGPFATSLAGSTVGLVGFGRVGRAVAQHLSGWNVRILAFDPGGVEALPSVRSVDLATLLRESDVISLHAVPTAQNRHLIGQAQISQMRETSVLINTARASLVDTSALVAALRSGRIAGAAIDVFDEEPPDPTAELFQLPNVIVTPHAAAWTKSGLENIAWHAARNLFAMLTGQGPVDIVNPTAKAVSIGDGMACKA